MPVVYFGTYIKCKTSFSKNEPCQNPFDIMENLPNLDDKIDFIDNYDYHYYYAKNCRTYMDQDFFEINLKNINVEQKSFAFNKKFANLISLLKEIYGENKVEVCCGVLNEMY
jgi:hypothetical protein